jgi:arylsulfatase A-like enzyme
MFVTADHGQSFGEHGMMFHLLRLDEQLLRVPLWMRPPGGDGGGRRARGWASLIDLYPTILRAAGGHAPDLPSAVPLLDLVDRERREPVFAMADGIVWDHIRKRFVEKDRELVWDRPLVAAYSGSMKVLMSANGEKVQAFNVDTDPGEGHDLWPSTEALPVELSHRARRIGESILAPPGQETDPEVEERLRSWGYV